MDGFPEPSSSLSYSSPSYLSNGSSRQESPVFGTSDGNCGLDPVTKMDLLCLTKLSSSLERILVEDQFDYTDAEIEVEGIPIGVHRCILAARSSFFHELFSKKSSSSSMSGKGKPKYSMSKLITCAHIGYEAFKDLLWYLYTGKLKLPDPEVSRCVDLGCPHDACKPAINYVVELMYASYVFQIEELILLFQRRLQKFVAVAYVEDVVPILLVASHCNLNQLTDYCVENVARSNLDDISLEKEFPAEIVQKIESFRHKTIEPVDQSNIDREKGIKRIHKALDSDDVELVKLLLSESEITLDEAFALHYAAAYCDPKVVGEILELGLADVNLKNSRGYTPLHVAAMRREPAVVISLLRKGAYASEFTSDYRSAFNICRRLTRHKDYFARTEQGKESNKDQICIKLLEVEMKRDHVPGEESVTSPLSADDLQMKLLYLENRVALAKLFFPSQAKLAMQIAETASKYALYGSLNERKEVDLNETPEVQRRRLLMKMDALSKTVELGKHYFPHCSQVLDKFMEDDLSDTHIFDEDASGEPDLKRKRYHEIKDDILKAFSKDKELSSGPPFKNERKHHRAYRK